MTSDTPEPQDPVRFSKPKSEPPILDLQAEKPAPENAAPKAEPPKQDAPRHDTLRVEKQPPRTWPVGGFLGGLIGGGIVALGMLAYAYVTDKTSAHITTLETALIEKVDRNIVAAFEKRLDDMEAALAETKAAIGAVAEKRATPDADLMKRIAALETAIRSLDANTPQSVISAVNDRSALRLALVLSLRDDIRNDQPVSRGIVALENSGETTEAFAVLKSNLSSPLVPFDQIRAEILSGEKSANIEEPSPSEQSKPESRISAFFSQLVTVRPAGPVAKVTSPDASLAALIDAVDQDDAKLALSALAALPQSEREKFKSVESELTRRIAVETAIAQLLDDALDAIAKGDTP